MGAEKQTHGLVGRVREGIKLAQKELENTVYQAANAIRALATPSAGEYADAVLCENGYSGDTAEIYFFQYRPKEFPGPSDAGFDDLMKDAARKAEYSRDCWNGWLNEIQAVNQIVQVYRGAIKVEDVALRDYLAAVRDSGETPDHRVHVTISMPGQNLLRFMRDLEEAISDFESSQGE